ncbi:xanthine dehydrogenase family protein molybdopterin-binding subunit [Saliphagus infecundisoli]|uniref:Xanthine dehydrogenase family protein molybdopterin-binding subunit n=1 Tax=Saliphagus infecundisoli TaxID=1849069 RepID=A0ABD5QGQ2_9EURY|nr:xanthine dehydrogenase family protein molybdopterin-binding subunit [Saliphagus infecundisoli]
MSEESDDLTGSPVPRREDEALLTGRATYTDDLVPPDAAHLTFVRSERAHADIESIDTRAAEKLEGVEAVYTWPDLADSSSPCVLPISTGSLDCEPPGHPVLARDRVRYHGQPVAAVVAEDGYRARDGVEAVSVNYDSREVVTDPEAAREEGAPTLFESAPDNVAATTEQGDLSKAEAAIEDADRVVSIDLENNRLISSAIEPRAAVAEYDAAADRLTVTMTSQSPHGHRGKLASTLGLPESAIRVIAPRVGGGFGHKGHHHPGEAMAAWAARDIERSVRWTATRSANYLEGAHARDHRTTAHLGVDADGTFRGLAVETTANVGGYGLGGGASMPGWYGGLLSSQYAIPAIGCRTRAVFTNTAPLHSYRGAGRPEAIYVTERIVDVAARELGIDRAELRRRNQISPDEFPYETAVGASYDSGDYEPALEKVLEAIGYDERTEDGTVESVESDDPDDGRLRGVGIACFTESTGGGFESGVVRVHPDGGVTVAAGTHSHGQGHETTYAQLVADELGVPMEAIDVREGDSDAIPKGTGTFGSRSTITGGSAVVESAREVREKAREIAAHRLEAAVEDVALEEGEFRVAGAPDRAISFEEVAGAAYGRGLSEDLEPGLEATTFYEPDGTAYAFGTHAALVAVDPATGDIEIERYVAVDDCGEQVNPTIVEGQVHGGVAQGIGQAMYEEAVYDDEGRLLSDSMAEYPVPRAEQLPDIETETTVTPSPRNPLGVKGIGEAGTIAAPPTIVGAVADALDVAHVDMPLTAERVREVLEE